MAASTEMGQGTNTIFSQIASEALRIDPNRIEIVQPDTSNVPNSGPTVASRTSMIVGKLVEAAALEIRTKLQGASLLAPEYSETEFVAACRQYIEKFGRLTGFVKYE